MPVRICRCFNINSNGEFLRISVFYLQNINPMFLFTHGKKLLRKESARDKKVVLARIRTGVPRIQRLALNAGATWPQAKLHNYSLKAIPLPKTTMAASSVTARLNHCLWGLGEKDSRERTKSPPIGCPGPFPTQTTGDLEMQNPYMLATKYHILLPISCHYFCARFWNSQSFSD